MGRRTTVEPATITEMPSEELNGDSNSEIRGSLTSAQRVTVSSTYNEVAPDPYGREAKHFTEIRVLNRDVSYFSHSLSPFLPICVTINKVIYRSGLF